MSDYRKLTVWLKAKDLAVAVHRLVRSSAMERERSLSDQMLRAAVSIASNIALRPVGDKQRHRK